MKIFENEEEAEELEKVVISCDLSDHNKILLIRCIENTITTNSISNFVQYKDISSRN